MPEHRNSGSPPALVMIYAISPLTTSPTIIIIKSLGCRWFFMPLLDVVTQYQVSLIKKRRHDSLFGLHIISHNYWCILYFATSSCWCWHTAREIYLIKYSYTCEPSHVDEARRQLFVLGNRTMGTPPPPHPFPRKYLYSNMWDSMSLKVDMSEHNLCYKLLTSLALDFMAEQQL